MDLSTPAIALFTVLRDTGENMSREEFSRDFPEADYDTSSAEALEELRNRGLGPQPAQAFRLKESRRVRFNRISPIPMRFD